VTPKDRAALQKSLRSSLEALRAKARPEIEKNRTDEARAGGDDDAQPFVEMGQAIASARNKHDAQTAERMAQALSKLANDPDGFGDCAECGEPIALKRLQAMPWAQYCVGCQAKKDGPRGGPTRRKVTDYT